MFELPYKIDRRIHDSSRSRRTYRTRLNFQRGVPLVKRSSPFVIYSIFIRQSALWRIKAWSYALDSRVLFHRGKTLSLPSSLPLSLSPFSPDRWGYTVATFNENSSALSFFNETENQVN